MVKNIVRNTKEKCHILCSFMESTVDPESFVGIQKKKLPSTIENSFLNLWFLSSNCTVAYNWDHVALITKKNFLWLLEVCFLRGRSLSQSLCNLQKISLAFQKTSGEKIVVGKVSTKTMLTFFVSFRFSFFVSFCNYKNLMTIEYKMNKNLTF